MNAQLVKVKIRLPLGQMHANSGEVEVELFADQLADALGRLSHLDQPVPASRLTSEQLEDLVIFAGITDRRIEACAALLETMISENDGGSWEPSAIEAITHAAEVVCQVANVNPGFAEAAVDRMRRASELALGGQVTP